MGHGGNTVTRMPEVVKAMEKLELLVVADPHADDLRADLGVAADGTYLLPICHLASRRDGSRTASNRSLQWGEQIVEPIFECRDDYDGDVRLGEASSASPTEMFKNIAVDNGKVVGRGHPARDQPRRLVHRLLRPVAGAAEGAHAQPGASSTWSPCARQAGTPEVGGEYYGLPWPCWGTPEMQHPGTHILYNTDAHVKEGGGTFRARFGVERNGETLLAEG